MEKRADNQPFNIHTQFKRYDFSQEAIDIILHENLLPEGLIKRLYHNYPEYAVSHNPANPFFTGKTHYSGLSGFKEITEILKQHGIELSHMHDREFFIEVYRFLVTKHILNAINWNNYKNDSNYYLVFPQPGMIPPDEVKKYANASTDAERKKVVDTYRQKTNPHDGKQKLNKPWFINTEGQVEVLQGCQHKYPPVILILDQSTQNCFAYCTYCFRHAQVRGDEDMFVQHEVSQVLDYVRQHKEITDLLITGGDAGYITYERLLEYITPLINDPELAHIKTVRIGSRALTYHPELILSNGFKKNLMLLKKLTENGIQAVWVAHLSTPYEIMNPGTIAAVRRIKSYGINIKSQSPVMSKISLFYDKNNLVDIDKSAKNWIDLANILAMLGIGFHSMYCARPTGEHHYFTAPLADISKIFNKVFRSVASFNRPSRYITMTSSAGKTSLLGTSHIHNEEVFVLKFNEARNMEWMDTTYFAKYDEKETVIEKLIPYDTDKFFYEDELLKIENSLAEKLEKEMNK